MRFRSSPHRVVSFFGSAFEACFEEIMPAPEFDTADL
jgi:hypothetical protein